MRNRSLLLLAAIALLACGCKPYRLTGIIAEGPTGQVQVISAGDSRANRPGIEGASVEFTLDPGTMSPKVLASVITDSEGRFDIEVDEVGAGFLEYELAILSRAKGFRPLYQEVQMPPKGKQLYITLQPGKDQYQPEPDLLKDTLKMGNDLLKKSN